MPSATRAAVYNSNGNLEVHHGHTNGIYVSPYHSNAYVNNVAHCYQPYHHDDYYHHGGCYPYYWPYYSFGFSIGFGFPFYGGYYADPWYGYPYHYPYNYGVYVGYPAYGYGYGGGSTSDTYVTNNYYPAPAAEEAPVEAPRAGAPAPVPPAAPAERNDADSNITPLPKLETVERGEGPAAGPEDARSQATASALVGLTNFRDGRYMEASESLFAAAQLNPESPALRVYLASSLFSIGEYGYSAQYLREALENRPSLALQDFDLGRLYAATPEGQADLTAHRDALKEHAALHPYDADGLLVLGFVQLNENDFSGAAASFVALESASISSSSQEMAARLLGAVQVRSLVATPGSQAEAAPFMAAMTGELPAEKDDLGEALQSALY